MPNTPLHIPDLINRGKWVDYRDPIWGDSYNWSWVRKWEEVKYLVIHHTVTSHDATPDDIALLHKARGWAGIGYHFVITKDGTVYYVGDISTARANVLNMNEQVIGITLVGDFTKHLPSDDQILSAHDLCKFFLFNAPALPNINGWEDVVGHKELQATACPGNDWKDTASSLYNRIKGRIPYTPQPTPQPEPIPQPQPDQFSIDLGVKSATVSQDNEKGIVAIEVEGVARKNGGEVAKSAKSLTVNFDKPEPHVIPVPEVIADKAQKINFGEHGVMSVQEAINKMTSDGESVEKAQEAIDEAIKIKNSKNWWWVKYRLWNNLFS